MSFFENISSIERFVHFSHNHIVIIPSGDDIDILPIYIEQGPYYAVQETTYFLISAYSLKDSKFISNLTELDSLNLPKEFTKEYLYSYID